MAVTRRAGGPYGQGGLRFTWQGATVAKAVDDALQQALDETRDAAVGRALQLVPVKTGQLKASIGGSVTVAGGKRQLQLYADAPYALYVELGTSRMSAQPFLRPAIDAEAPKLTERIRAALQGGS